MAEQWGGQGEQREVVGGLREEWRGPDWAEVGGTGVGPGDGRR